MRPLSQFVGAKAKNVTPEQGVNRAASTSVPSVQADSSPMHMRLINSSSFLKIWHSTPYTSP